MHPLDELARALMIALIIRYQERDDAWTGYSFVDWMREMSDEWAGRDYIDQFKYDAREHCKRRKNWLWAHNVDKDRECRSYSCVLHSKRIGYCSEDELPPVDCDGVCIKYKVPENRSCEVENLTDDHTKPAN